MLMRTTRETFSFAVNYVARVLGRDFCPLFDGSLRIVISLTGSVSSGDQNVPFIALSG